MILFAMNTFSLPLDATLSVVPHRLFVYCSIFFARIGRTNLPKNSKRSGRLSATNIVQKEKSMKNLEISEIAISLDVGKIRRGRGIVNRRFRQFFKKSNQ